MNAAKEMQKTKRTNYILLRVLAVVAIAVIIASIVYHQNHTFSTSKWLNNPQKRTEIIDNLFEQHKLVGMTEADVVALLGEPNNDYGYFHADNRYVYYLGPERGLISIDSEWLILDFTDGIVDNSFITRD